MALSEEHEKEALRYDLAALRLHVEQRRRNIEIFEKAIRDERDGIERDQGMIAFLEAKRGPQV